MTATRAEVQALARELIGTPYQFRGRSRAGLDCGGLIVLVGLELGLMKPRDDLYGYDEPVDPKLLRTQMHKVFDRLPNQEAQPGDVVLIRTMRFPAHLAIMSELPSGEASLLHAYNFLGGTGGRAETLQQSGRNGREGVVESRQAPWARRCIGFFAYKGVK